MLYQLSYDHHVGTQCAIRAAQFHHRVVPRNRLDDPQRLTTGAAVTIPTVHDGFRGALGLRERDPRGDNDMSATESIPTRELAERAKVITQRELQCVHQPNQRARSAATATGPRGAAAGCSQQLPGLRPPPDRGAPGAGRLDGRRRRQPLRRLRHGLRRPVLRPLPPAVRRAVETQLDNGTLFVTPCEMNAEVAELLRDRYNLPMWRFTNSGTEATMDAIRVARGVTGREKIVKVEGGYHGHHDEVMISMKPPISEAGPADNPHRHPVHGGHHPRRAGRHQGHPVQQPGGARAGAGGWRHVRASSSSR
jgi:hypothetical protein